MRLHPAVIFGSERHESLAIETSTCRLTVTRKSCANAPPVGPYRVERFELSVTVMTDEEVSTDHPILVAVGFDGSAREALQQGALRAKTTNTPMTVLHVVHRPIPIVAEMGNLPGYDRGDEPELMRRVSERVTKLVEEQALGLKKGQLRIEVDVAETPHAAIVSKADQVGARLLVVGHRGHSGFARLVLGSVARRVARTAPCPVLLARSHAPSRRMLVTTDFSEVAQRALEFAVSEARALDYEIVLHHHIELASPLWSSLSAFGPIPPQMDEETLRQVEAATQQLLRDQLTRAGVTGRVLVSAGSATDEAIVHVASDHGAELIVMGSHGRTGVQRIALGSTTESVLMHAHCSVIAVH